LIPDRLEKDKNMSRLFAPGSHESGRAFRRWKYLVFGALVLSVILLLAASSWGEPFSIPSIQLNVGDGTDEPGKVAVALQLLLLLTVLSLAPAILIMLTSFTRIVVVLSLLRHALGTQQMPANQIIVGLALFLTFFIMTPVWNTVNSQALQPYLQEEISAEKAFALGKGGETPEPR